MGDRWSGTTGTTGGTRSSTHPHHHRVSPSDRTHNSLPTTQTPPTSPPRGRRVASVCVGGGQWGVPDLDGGGGSSDAAPDPRVVDRRVQTPGRGRTGTAPESRDARPVDRVAEAGVVQEGRSPPLTSRGPGSGDPGETDRSWEESRSPTRFRTTVLGLRVTGILYSCVGDLSLWGLTSALSDRLREVIFFVLARIR